MFVCPVCKTTLLNNRCSSCNFVILYKNGVPRFFTNTNYGKKYCEIGEFYDKLYSNVEDTWNKIASRGKSFNQFISELISSKRPEKYIDIGCGEGHLIAAVEAKEKFGLDISEKALQAAHSKCCLQSCLGYAEELPFPDHYFDLISSMGVMTHFIDDLKATKEIKRVIKPGGYYILGVYVKPSIILDYYNRFVTLIRNPKPFGVILKKLKKTITRSGKRHNNEYKQPIERYYSKKDILKILNSAAFILEKEITKFRNPRTPLPGPHFRIYIFRA